MNQATLIGNVGKDPEVITTQSGKQIAKFSLATSDGENTQWHNIIAWEKTAEIISKYVHKGNKLAIIGRITYRSWDDKEGVKRYSTEIIAERVELLPNRDSDVAKQEVKPETKPEAPQSTEPSDDLPF